MSVKANKYDHISKKLILFPILWIETWASYRNICKMVSLKSTLIIIRTQ